MTKAYPTLEGPTLGTLKGVQYFCRTSDGQWYYINHAGTWQACPPPFEMPPPAAAEMGDRKEWEPGEMMNLPEIFRERVVGILMQHPEGVPAKDMCETLIRHGWAFPDLTPECLGLDADAIIRLKR